MRRGFRRGRNFRFQSNQPVKKGEEYDVEITEVGSKGDGIARVKNFVVFVKDTKKGEKAHIKITDVKRRFAIGEKVSETEKQETEHQEEQQEEVEEETEELPAEEEAEE